MKVVFLEDVEGTAQVGEVKEVKNGFARNFLLPRNLAVAPTKDNMQRAMALAQKEARRQAKLDAEAKLIVDRIAGYTVTIEAHVGETGRLFGSITNRDIAEKLNTAAGTEIDSHIVFLPEPIRELGRREVTIRFTRNITAEVTVDVVPDEQSKPAVAKLLADREAEAAALEKARAAQAYAAAQKAETAASTSADQDADDEEETEE